MTTSPRADDPPQSKIVRSVCPKKGFTLFLFTLCSILVLEKNLWGTKNDLHSFAFLVGSIHRSKVSDSSAHESVSSDDSLLKDPFSLQYVLHVTYFSVVISCEKVHKSSSREEMEKKQTRTKSPSNFTAEIKLYLCFRTSLNL